MRSTQVSAASASSGRAQMSPTCSASARRAAAVVVLDEVPRLLPRVRELGERFEAAGWHGAGLLRARAGDAQAAERNRVIVIPAGEDGSLISATPAFTISDEEFDEAL